MYTFKNKQNLVQIGDNAWQHQRSMINDKIDGGYLELLELNNDGKEEFDRLIEYLQLPIDIVPLLYKHSDLSLHIDDNVIGFILIEGWKRRQSQPFHCSQSMLKLIHKTNWW